MGETPSRAARFGFCESHCEVKSPPGPNLHNGASIFLLNRSIVTLTNVFCFLFAVFARKTLIGKQGKKTQTKTEQK